MKLAIFDIGGSAVKYGLWEQHQLSQTSQFPTPATFEEMKEQMKEVVDLFGVGVEGVAISAPGAVNVPERRIDGISAVPYIHKRPIFDELEEYLGLPVTIENDANCAGIAEIQMGAGQDAVNAVFVVIGTGVGGAIFINRKLYKASHLFGGEFGLVKPKGDRTLSQAGTSVKAAQQYSQITKKEVNGKELFDLKEAGDKTAELVINELYDNIAAVLYNLQVSIDPDMVIIGGGISARPELPEELGSRLYKTLAEEEVEEIMPEIRNCQFHNDANLIGAASNFELYYQEMQERNLRG